jgi:hypothetical protein
MQEAADGTLDAKWKPKGRFRDQLSAFSSTDSLQKLTTRHIDLARGVRPGMETGTLGLAINLAGGKSGNLHVTTLYRNTFLSTPNG